MFIGSFECCATTTIFIVDILRALCAVSACNIPFGLCEFRFECFFPVSSVCAFLFAHILSVSVVSCFNRNRNGNAISFRIAWADGKGAPFDWHMESEPIGMLLLHIPYLLPPESRTLGFACHMQQTCAATYRTEMNGSEIIADTPWNGNVLAESPMSRN